MGHAADIDDARAWRGQEGVQQQACESEMAQVVGAELQLKAVLGLGVRRDHDPGIVDQQVQTVIFVSDLCREVVH